MTSKLGGSALATWPLLLALCVCLLVGWGEVLRPLDEVVRGWLVELQPQRLSTDELLVVEIDAKTVAKLGAPPWSHEEWLRLRASLSDAGFGDVVVLEPSARLVREKGSTAIDGFVQPGWPARAMPGAPFAHMGVQLRAPLHDGVWWGVGAPAASSFWCDLARCPEGDALSTPISASITGSIPSVSLWDVVNDEVRVQLDREAVVLLGLTAAQHAQTVPVGASGEAVPWVQAVAIALAVLDAAPITPTPGPLLTLPLVALLVVLGAALAHLEVVLPVDVWLFVLPPLVALGVAVPVALGVVHLPVLDLVFAAAAGPLAEVLRVRWRTARFLRAASLQIARSDLGTVWGDALDGEPHALLRRLASLTWNHFPTDRMVYLHRVGSRIEVVGGFGLGAADLVPAMLRGPALAQIARRGRCDSLFVDTSMRGQLLPIYRDGVVLGYWCVAWSSGESEPSTPVLVELARWVEQHLIARETAEGGASLLHLDRELEAISATLDRSASTRAWQGKVLQGMQLPMAIADRAGTIVFRNNAFVEVFSGSVPESVRGLVWSVLGEDGLSERMRELFVHRVPIELTLDGGHPLRIVATGDAVVEGFSLVGSANHERASQPAVGAAEVCALGPMLRSVALQTDPRRVVVQLPEPSLATIADGDQLYDALTEVIEVALDRAGEHPITVSMEVQDARVAVRIVWPRSAQGRSQDDLVWGSASQLFDDLAPVVGDAEHVAWCLTVPRARAA